MKVKLLIIRLLLILISTVATLLLVEILLRSTRTEPPRNFYTFIEYHPTLGWQHIPRKTTRHRTPEFDVAVEFNARGLRGPEKPYRPSPGTFRILVLGDSFVEGHGVAERESFPYLLEKKLNKFRADVVSFGVSGYGTDQQLLWLESEGFKYEPDIVLLLMYYDDIMPNLLASSWGIPKPRFVRNGDELLLTNVPVPVIPQTNRFSTAARMRLWLKENSAVYSAMQEALIGSSFEAIAVAAGLLVPPVVKETDPWYEQRVFRTGYQEVGSAWNTTGKLLERMAHSAKTKNAELVVFHIPIRERIYPSTHWIVDEFRMSLEEWNERVYEKQLQKVLGELKIPLINPESDFGKLAQQGRKLYFANDLHWNAEGHRAAAAIAAEYLAKNQ